MSDGFVGEPSESFVHDILFPWLDGLAVEYDLNSEQIMSDARRWLRPSLVDEYSIWISESWEPIAPVVPLAVHGPEAEPAIFKPSPEVPA